MFLHNRRPGIGQRYGDIDHIAIAPSGIYVIDAKNYRNAKVRVAQPGIFSRADPKLMIRGRNRTSLVDGLTRQKESVDEALDGRAEPWPVPVMAMFCFLDADFPLFERLSIRGHLVRGQRGTARILNRPGPMTAEHRETLWNHLAGQLPSA